MKDYSIRLKQELEAYFSMPFDVSSHIKDNENHFICAPSNEGNLFFFADICVRNHIRLIIEMYPQKHGGYILNEMGSADAEKRKKFELVFDMMTDKGARIDFLVNNSKLSVSDWPEHWRNFSSKIVLLPLPDVTGEDAEFNVISEWAVYCFDLIFALLTISDIDEESKCGLQTEGTPSEIKSIRYERNPVNRQLCLYRQGYTCAVCGFNFHEVYGDIGYHYIEVHHKMPVSMMTPDYPFDVDKDLVPLCSNCHSMAHRRCPPYTIDELKSFLKKNRTEQ